MCIGPWCAALHSAKTAKSLMSLLWEYLVLFSFCFFFLRGEREAEFCLTSQSRCRHTGPAGRFCLLFAGRRPPRLHKTLWSRLPGRRCQEVSFCSLLLLFLLFFYRPPPANSASERFILCNSAFHPRAAPCFCFFYVPPWNKTQLSRPSHVGRWSKNVGLRFVLLCAARLRWSSCPRLMSCFWFSCKLPTRNRDEPLDVGLPRTFASTCGGVLTVFYT